jgi:hypothetical protein
MVVVVGVIVDPSIRAVQGSGKGPRFFALLPLLVLALMGWMLSGAFLGRGSPRSET